MGRAGANRLRCEVPTRAGHAPWRTVACVRRTAARVATQHAPTITTRSAAALRRSSVWAISRPPTGRGCFSASCPTGERGTLLGNFPAATHLAANPALAAGCTACGSPPHAALPLQLVQDGAAVLCALPAPLRKLLAERGTAGLAAGSVPRHLLLQPSIQQRSHPPLPACPPGDNLCRARWPRSSSMRAQRSCPQQTSSCRCLHGTPIGWVLWLLGRWCSLHCSTEAQVRLWRQT